MPSIVGRHACGHGDRRRVRRRLRRRSAPAGSASTSFAACRWSTARSSWPARFPQRSLALAVDGGLLWVERQLSTRRRSASRRTVLAAAAVVAAVMLASGRRGRSFRRGDRRRLEELHRTGDSRRDRRADDRARHRPSGVQRRLNLGGTLICDRALTTGDIDVYVEYTGTALTAVFHRPVTTSADAAYEDVRQQYARRADAAAGVGIR